MQAGLLGTNAELNCSKILLCQTVSQPSFAIENQHQISHSYGGVLKGGYPSLHHFSITFHYKPSILGYPHDYGDPHIPSSFCHPTPPPQAQDAMVAAKDTTYASHLPEKNSSITIDQTIEFPSESKGHPGFFPQKPWLNGGFPHQTMVPWGVFHRGMGMGL